MSGSHELCLFANEKLDEFDGFGAMSRSAGDPQRVGSQGCDSRALSTRDTCHSSLVAERLIYCVNLIHFGPPELKRRGAGNPTCPLCCALPSVNNPCVVYADPAVGFDDMATPCRYLPVEPLAG